MAFYQTLPGERLVWIALGENELSNRMYLTEHGIEPRIVLSAVYAGLTKINATPALIVVGADGHVIRSWVGQLNSAAEDQVRATIRTFF